MKKQFTTAFLVTMISASGSAWADAPPEIRVLPSRQIVRASVPENRIIEQALFHFSAEDYREIRMQPIYGADGTPDHLLVYLLAKDQHRVTYRTIAVDAEFHFLSVTTESHTLTNDEITQQPGIEAFQAKCPNPNVEFVSMCPNRDPRERKIAIAAADAARTKGLNTVELIGAAGNRTNYLNYMSCPKLRGNFYDGDADPQSIVTSDGEISATDISTVLHNAFRYETTNIWVACEAFNNPMLAAVTEDAEAKKYAAGINDLAVGPSDNTALCAMKAALAGQPMTEAFQQCYQQDDTPADQWGFNGEGSDYF